MSFSESYFFVLLISSLLCIPLGLAIRTLLNTKERVILPILRLCMTKNIAKSIMEPSLTIDRTSALTQSSNVNLAYPLKHGGNHGDRRSVDGKKRSEH